jgi:hypothetical protein
MLRVRSYLLPRLSRATGRPAGSARRPSRLLPVQRARVVDGFRGRGSRRQPAGRRGRGVGDRGHGGRWPARCGAAAWAAHRLARHTAQRTTVRVGDPADTVPHRAHDAFPALPGRRVRHRLTPTKWGIPPHRAQARCGTGACAAHSCRGEAPPRPPAPEARQSIVADTSRPTRSADQTSGPLHDRPAVNGRAQSPSRLKPADPYGPCTQPIDPGTWAPHSPLQGAYGLSPGLQPRAFAADHPGSDGRGTTAPFGVALPALPGRRVRHRLTPTKRGRSPDRSRPCTALVLDRPTCVGARRAPRPTAPIGAANPCARYRRHRRSIRHRAHYRTRGLTGPTTAPSGRALHGSGSA